MPQYKKKVPTIHAEQFDEGQEPLPDGVIERTPGSYWLIAIGLQDDEIPGGPGGQPIEFGDWIVNFSDGTRFRCKPDEFDATFELDDEQ